MIIGTAGHVDHGKTSLVRALTGVDTDRLKDEKARGISIDLGFAYFTASDGVVLGFVDVPGHEKFIHNMLAGATGIDFVLLTVAADDGIMPQTREHLAIIDLLGVRRGLIALTKCDLVAAEQINDISAELVRLTDRTALAGSEILPVSSITGEGMELLKNRLFAAARALAGRAGRGRFRLAVDRSFVLAGAGTVVTGTILTGSVTVGDHVMVSPSGLNARIRSIHTHNKAAKSGAAGDRCALNLVGESVRKEAIVRGDMIVDPELHSPTDRIDAHVRLLASEPKPMTQWFPTRLHHAATEVGARVVILGDKPITPGAESRVQLVLERPIAAAIGDRFILRDATAQRTLGGGWFLDLWAPPRRRRTRERLAQLDAHSLPDPEQALAALLDLPPHYVDLTTFGRDRALSAGEIDKLADPGMMVRLIAGKCEIALSTSHWQDIRQNIIAMLAGFHAENPNLPGMGSEQLRRKLYARFSAEVFHSILQRVSRDREIVLEGAWVHLSDHEVRLTPSDEKIWRLARPLLAGDNRFRPPQVRDVASLLSIHESEIRRLMKLLSRMEQVVELAHDHFFLRATVDEMVEIACDIAAKSANGEFTVAVFRDHLDNGRKVAIRILEFLDRNGLTIRRGDLRRINKSKIGMFRRQPRENSSLSVSS